MPTGVNMIEFYQSKYNICLENIQALDVSIEESRKAYWPMEICKILPGQLYPRLLNKEELSVLPGATSVSGKERMLNIQEVRLNELYISSKPTYDGVKVRNKVREVTARILPLPDVRPVTYDTKVENWRILNFSHHESTEV
ncbi:protein argonaute MEL1, partial [Tanacetum coccineum]